MTRYMPAVLVVARPPAVRKQLVAAARTAVPEGKVIAAEQFGDGLVAGSTETLCLIVLYHDTAGLPDGLAEAVSKSGCGVITCTPATASDCECRLCHSLLPTGRLSWPAELSKLATMIEAELQRRRVDRFVTDTQTRLSAATSHPHKQLEHAERMAALGYWSYDMTTNQMAWSEGIYELLGMVPEECPASLHAGLSFVHPDDITATLAALERAATEGVADLELRIVRRSGEQRQVRACGDLVLRNGNPAMIYGVLKDLTEQRSQARQLEASQANFRAVFEASTDGIALFEQPSLRLHLSNPQFRTLTGYREGTTSHAADLLPEDADSDVEACYRALLDGSQPVAIDLPIRRVEGEAAVADITRAQVMLDGHSYCMLTLREATERNRLRSVLVQADRLSAMGMLAAGIAHELNNPLTYATYNLESVLEDVSEATDQALDLGDIADRLESAIVGVHRVQEIVADLGTFARIDRRSERAIDVNSAVRIALNIASTQLKYRAQLHIELNTIPRVLANEGKLAQVFLNILLNAAQAIDEGNYHDNEVAIRSWHDGDGDDDGLVAVEIRDTGPGISEDDLAKIFTPLFTTKAQGLGTGMGLPICRSILESYGGQISVESALGHGTRVVVHLPTAQDLLKNEPELTNIATPNRGTVLIVDDDPMVARVFERILRSGVDAVTIVCSGREAQELLQAGEEFDAIVCDLLMPDMSGSELYDWLSAEDPALADRMIFVTGGAFTAASQNLLARVPNRRLKKPVDPDKLRREVHRLIVASHPPTNPEPEAEAEPEPEPEPEPGGTP